VPDNDRERFEQEYKDWIRLMSRDAAFRLAALPPEQRECILKAYEDFKEPGSVFRDLSAEERVKRLAGESISKFIVIETDAIAIFPSICSSIPGAMDFAVAMNRCLFCDGLWFPVISLNSRYISLSSDRVLAFALEHEFEMNRIYQEIFGRQQLIPPEKRLEIMQPAKGSSQTRLTITAEELIEDERIMHRLALTSPLLPKPYAELAMLHYIEANLTRLASCGRESSGAEEQAFGEEIALEFSSWAEFSRRTYELFVREITSNLKDADQGYV